MINIRHLTKTVTQKTLFEDISFKLGDGHKVGLVGPNGVGKTTLLQIILGNVDADRGEVLRTNEVIGYLPQKLQIQPSEEVGQYLQRFLSGEWEVYKIDQILAKVGLKGLSPQTPIAQLSGGQKMKVALAGVLLIEPTTLLFDEPTNNLDVASLQWLEQFVQRFEGKVLLISHDRYFLDACVTKIIELDPFTHQIVEYGGNYSAYKQQKAVRHQHAISAYQRQQEKEHTMKDWIAEKQQQLKYHANPKVARQLQAMKTRLQREVLAQKLAKPKTYQAFSLDEVGHHLHKRKTLFLLKNVSVPALWTISELLILGQERIHLAGKNGSGKTTLLRVLLGLSPVQKGKVQRGPNVKVGYFSQEHELLQTDEGVINLFMRQTENYDESTARTILGKFLFSQQKVFSPVRTLSEGEKARLVIAIIISQHNDFLLLDEPTNHLDLESREVLATALQEYEGGFLVVSHDRYFLQQIGIERRIEIKN